MPRARGGQVRIDSLLKLYIGIDPGMTGGISVIRSGKRSLPEVYKMPNTERDIYDLLEDIANRRSDIAKLTEPVLAKLDSAEVGYQRLNVSCFIEKVHSMPKDGKASAFKFGMSYGFLRGCLIGLKIPFEEVTPQKWVKGMGIPYKDKTETRSVWKNRLKAKAQQLYPCLDVTLQVADSLLIATYCQRTKETYLANSNVG